MNAQLRLCKISIQVFSHGAWLRHGHKWSKWHFHGFISELVTVCFRHWWLQFSDICQRQTFCLSLLIGSIYCWHGYKFLHIYIYIYIYIYILGSLKISIDLYSSAHRNPSFWSLSWNWSRHLHGHYRSKLQSNNVRFLRATTSTHSLCPRNIISGTGGLSSKYMWIYIGACIWLTRWIAYPRNVIARSLSPCDMIFQVMGILLFTALMCCLYSFPPLKVYLSASLIRSNLAFWLRCE